MPKSTLQTPNPSFEGGSLNISPESNLAQENRRGLIETLDISRELSEKLTNYREYWPSIIEGVADCQYNSKEMEAILRALEADPLSDHFAMLPLAPESDYTKSNNPVFNIDDNDWKSTNQMTGFELNKEFITSPEFEHVRQVIRSLDFSSYSKLSSEKLDLLLFHDYPEVRILNFDGVGMSDQLIDSLEKAILNGKFPKLNKLFFDRISLEKLIEMKDGTESSLYEKITSLLNDNHIESNYCVDFLEKFHSSYTGFSDHGKRMPFPGDSIDFMIRYAEQHGYQIKYVTGSMDVQMRFMKDGIDQECMILYVGESPTSNYLMLGQQTDQQDIPRIYKALYERLFQRHMMGMELVGDASGFNPISSLPNAKFVGHKLIIYEQPAHVTLADLTCDLREDRNLAGKKGIPEVMSGDTYKEIILGTAKAMGNFHKNNVVAMAAGAKRIFINCNEKGCLDYRNIAIEANVPYSEKVMTQKDKKGMALVAQYSSPESFLDRNDEKNLPHFSSKQMDVFHFGSMVFSNFHLMSLSPLAVGVGDYKSNQNFLKDKGGVHGENNDHLLEVDGRNANTVRYANYMEGFRVNEVTFPTDMPRELAHIIRRCLAKPEERYSDMNEVHADLKELFEKRSDLLKDFNKEREVSYISEVKHLLAIIGRIATKKMMVDGSYDFSCREKYLNRSRLATVNMEAITGILSKGEEVTEELTDYWGEATIEEFRLLIDELKKYQVDPMSYMKEYLYPHAELVPEFALFESDRK